MVPRSRRPVTGPSANASPFVGAPAALSAEKRWLWPLGLVVLITVLHFSIDPHLMFWHDLLRRAFYVPIIWMVYLSGFRGGVVASVLVGVIFTIHLLIGWGHHLGSQMDQVYDILGYVAVGLGVGYTVDRARQAAVAAAQRDWDISLRGVISAAIHQLKHPKTEIQSLADTLLEQSHAGMWEHSIGLRLARASGGIDDLRRDLAGIAKILSSGSAFTKPFDWAMRFAEDKHLGGRFGIIVTRTDRRYPPPALWPVSPQILDEVSRCLLEDFSAEGKLAGVIDLVISSRNDTLDIEFSSNSEPRTGHTAGDATAPPYTRGWVRMKLLELTWSRYSGTTARFDDGARRGFRLTLQRPRLRLAPTKGQIRHHLPARRIQESSRIYVKRAAKPHALSNRLHFGSE